MRFAHPVRFPASDSPGLIRHMNFDFQWVKQDVVYRYSRDAGPDTPTADGYANFKHALRPRRADQSLLQLEKGISVSREVLAADGPRRPVVLLRSSPWKAGTETTPWHDEYDLKAGSVRYYGDSKPGRTGTGHGSSGNRSLGSLAPLYQSSSRSERQLAPPIALFRGESGEIAGKGLVHKGFVRFIGLGVLAGHSPVRQVDADGVPFENIVFEVRLCPLDDAAGRVDWSWINDRRDATVPTAVANLRAPYAWRHWIETGRLPSQGQAY